MRLRGCNEKAFLLRYGGREQTIAIWRRVAVIRMRVMQRVLLLKLPLKKF